MRRGNGTNRHGQPFSKKQRQASRSMMENRKMFTRNPNNSPNLNAVTPGMSTGLLAGLFGLMMMGRRRSRG